MTAPDDLFGSVFACACGRTHRIEPREVIYGRWALDRLGEAAARAAQGRRAAVIMDARTRDILGEAAALTLAESGWKAAEIVVPDPAPGRSPVCDDATKDAVAARIGTVDLLVAVGGGVLSDLTKWIAEERGVAFLTIPTAASMNGYASANVAPTVGGVKTLVRAHPPCAILAEPVVIEEAPWELTASGLGDILAKSVSSSDWLMNRLFFGDYYCARAVGLIAEIEPLYLDAPEQLRARAPEAISALFRGLLLTGVAMTMAETSAPSSGGEHMISHALDMMASRDGAAHDLHGRQVGVGTVLTSELYRRVLAVESPRFVAAPAEVDAAFWGPLASGVKDEYARKQERLRAAAEHLRAPGAWDAFRRSMKPLVRTPEAIRNCLRRADAAYRAEHIRCDRARLLAAFRHAHEIRSRFTILDLAHLLGILPSAADEIVEAWA